MVSWNYATISYIIDNILLQLSVEYIRPCWITFFVRRNDYISSVREAAEVALKQIGGEEANNAMHMTEVLAEEIQMLTQVCDISAKNLFSQQ